VPPADEPEALAAQPPALEEQPPAQWASPRGAAQPQASAPSAAERQDEPEAEARQQLPSSA